MVKNKTGGNKSKKSARKHISQPVNRKLRLVEEEGEQYAAVIKLYGGPNCEVICNDGITRLCVIRNKFRGRDKRDNNIAPGVWVLVGIRDWEARTNKAEKCDLLEVYNSTEKDKLKSIKSINFTKLLDASDDNENTDSNIIFEDDIISNHKKNINDEINDDEINDNEINDNEIDDDFIDIDEI